LDQGLEIMKGVVALGPQNVQEKDTLAQFYLTSGGNYLRWHLFERAIKNDEDACSIYGDLRSHDSDNHVDLNISECRAKLGFAFLQAGKIEAADAAFHQSLSLAGPFLAADKPELSALYDDADASSGMGDAVAHLAAVSPRGPQSEEHWKRAEDWYRKSLSVWQRVPADRQERYNRSLAEPDP
jgi:tetratricopeptide (TPR) repeat protein